MTQNSNAYSNIFISDENKIIKFGVWCDFIYVIITLAFFKQIHFNPRCGKQLIKTVQLLYILKEETYPSRGPKNIFQKEFVKMTDDINKFKKLNCLFLDTKGAVISFSCTVLQRPHSDSSFPELPSLGNN